MPVPLVSVTKVANPALIPGFLCLNVPSYFFSPRSALTSLVRRHAHQQPCGNVVPSPLLWVLQGSVATRQTPSALHYFDNKKAEYTYAQLKLKSNRYFLPFYGVEIILSLLRAF